MVLKHLNVQSCTSQDLALTYVFFFREHFSLYMFDKFCFQYFCGADLCKHITNAPGDGDQSALSFFLGLTLKAPNKNCSRRHFNFLLLSFEENKAWFFMLILCLAEDSLKTSSLIFSEKQWKNIYEYHLLQSWLALPGFKKKEKKWNQSQILPCVKLRTCSFHRQ